MKKIYTNQLIFLLVIFVISTTVFSQKLGETAKLTPADGEIGDFFGNSVATTGEIAVIGAWFKNNLAGAVYIFRRNGSEWSEEEKLVPSDASDYDFFGNSVDVYEDYVIIGASGAGNVGAAYIFKYNGNSWDEIQKLTPANGMLYDQYGSAVAINEEYAIVGARNAQSLKGAVYVYQKNGNNWTNEEMLTGTLYASSFGCAVDIDEEAIIIGASDNSYAYVFMLDGDTWTMTAELEDVNGSVYDEFGSTVSIDGDLAIVGATHHQNGNGATGAAYIYKRQGSNWVEDEKLVADDGELDDHFGIVSMYGNNVVIGAYSDDDYGMDAGSAYLYQKENDNWIFKEKLNASDGFAGDELGSSTAIFEDIILIGAPDDNDNGAESGSAYIFIYDPQMGIVNNNSDCQQKYIYAYPNPFHTHITFQFLCMESNLENIYIYNINGQLERFIPLQQNDKEKKRLVWDGRNNYGESVKKGIYYCCFRGKAVEEHFTIIKN